MSETDDTVPWRRKYERLGEALDMIESLDGVHLVDGPRDIQDKFDSMTAATIEIAAKDEVLEADE